MLCGVTATLGSNPSATATAARPHWGRAVLLCLPDVLCCCVAPRVFRAPEGPAAREARRPHFVRRRASKPARALRSLRRPPHRRCRIADVCSARRLVVRPGLATAHGRRSQALPPSTGAAARPCLEARPCPPVPPQQRHRGTTSGLECCLEARLGPDAAYGCSDGFW